MHNDCLNLRASKEGDGSFRQLDDKTEPIDSRLFFHFVIGFKCALCRAGNQLRKMG